MPDPSVQSSHAPAARLLIAVLGLLCFISALAHLSPDAPAPSLAQKPLHQIPVNCAPLAELQLLPNVGPKLAQKIIEQRQIQPFTSPDDMRRVSGIGPLLPDRLRPHVRFD